MSSRSLRRGRRALMFSGGNAGSSRNFVLPQRGDLFGWSAWDASAVDTPTRVNQANSLGMGHTSTTGTINNSVGMFMLLDSGTYRLDFLHVTFTTLGIYTVQVDGVTVGTFDGYSAGATYNVLSSITGLTLSAGRHTITCLMATKNASATLYRHGIHSVTATRTGA